MTVGFNLITGSIVIYKKKFVHNQGPVYERNGSAYLKCCGGFIRMQESGRTLHPDVSWLELTMHDNDITPKAMSGKYLGATHEPQ